MGPSPLVSDLSMTLVWLASLAVVPRTYVPAVHAFSSTEALPPRQRIRSGLQALAAFTLYCGLLAGVAYLHLT